MFLCTITPRFGDTDGLRHINNICLPEWFETARNDLFRIFNPELDFEQWNLIMVHLDIDFKGQLYYGKDVEIRTWISKIGNTSFTVYQEAWQNGALGASGSAVIVHFDFATQKPQPLTDQQRTALECHALAAEA